MSSSLYYQPTVPLPPADGGWKMPLKTIITRQYFDGSGDGSLCYRDPVTLTVEKDSSFLQGVLAAAEGDLKRQTQELLEALVENESINIWIE